jgi:hypothetical protein
MSDTYWKPLSERSTAILARVLAEITALGLPPSQPMASPDQSAVPQPKTETPVSGQKNSPPSFRREG